MSMTLEQFFTEASSSVTLFNEWAEREKPAARADHLCYKCGTSDEFELLRALFEPASDFVYQSIISNRRIAIIKFRNPIPTALGEISFLELSDQKPDGSQVSGFDHIELYPTDGTIDALVKTLESKGVSFEKTVRPHHTTFDTVLETGFKIRLEEEPLVEKIKRDEMR